MAATLYANSSTGNDTTGNGTAGTPYKTFTKAYAMSSSGDTIDLTGTFDWINGGETTSATTGFTIAKNLTIQGQGANQTIVQANSSSTGSTNRRVFTISAGYTVTIQKLTVRYGYVTSGYNGGGILTQGTLTVDRCAISYNVAPTGSGGGINTMDATLTLQNSTVDHNTAQSQGAGVYTDYYNSSNGVANIINSTIVYNNITGTVATIGGGGICFRGSGGTITNSTIAFNDLTTGTAVGAGIFYYPNNGAASLYIKNSIVAGNTRGGAAISNGNYGDIVKSAGTVTDNGYNIFGYNLSSNMTLASSSFVDATSGTLDGTFVRSSPSTSGTLSLSSTLADNSTLYGTQTLALTSAGTIAVGSGNSSNNSSIVIPSLDQRGLSRDVNVDIGAYEYGASSLVSEPTVQASNVVFSSVAQTQMTASWTNGDGSTRAVFIKQSNTGTASPVDGSSYTANTVFGSGNQISSSGWYMVYNGSGTSVTVTGLTANTAYIVQVFEFNGSGGTENYLTASATGNPATQTTLANTFTLTYTAGTGGTISGTSPQTVTAGASGSVVTAVPSTGYYFTSWSDASTTNPRTDSSVNANISVTAQFALSTYILNYTAADSHGTISGAIPQTVSFGGNGSAVTAIPNTGYHFVSWSDGSINNPRADSNIQASISVSASFAPDLGGAIIIPIIPQAFVLSNSKERAGLDFIINNGKKSTKNPVLNISLNADPDTVFGYVVSLDPTFIKEGIYPYKPEVTFTLPDVSGSYTIYLKYYSKTGMYSELLSHTIDYKSGLVVKNNILNNNQVDVLKSNLPVSSNTFDRSFSLGDRGDDVKRLQVFLNNQGFILAENGPGSPGQETDLFGILTKKQLMKFQEKYFKDVLAPLNLKRGTGVFGEYTKNFINSLINT